MGIVHASRIECLTCDTIEVAPMGYNVFCETGALNPSRAPRSLSILTSRKNGPKKNVSSCNGVKPKSSEYDIIFQHSFSLGTPSVGDGNCSCSSGSNFSFLLVSFPERYITRAPQAKNLAGQNKRKRRPSAEAFFLSFTSSSSR